MRHLVLSVGLLVAIALAGCVPMSIHPGYTDDDLVFDQSLLGTWGENENDLMIFESLDDRAYTLTFREDSKTAKFEAHLIELLGVRLLDLIPSDLPAEINETYQAHLLPLHSLFRVTIENDRLQLHPLDYDRLKDELAAEPALVEFTLAYDNVILTSDTERLREFLLLCVSEDYFGQDPFEARRLD